MLRGLLIAAGAYTTLGVCAVLYKDHQTAKALAAGPAPAPGGVIIPPKHPLMAEAFRVAIWPLVLLDPFKK